MAMHSSVVNAVGVFLIPFTQSYCESLGNEECILGEGSLTHGKGLRESSHDTEYVSEQNYTDKHWMVPSFFASPSGEHCHSSSLKFQVSISPFLCWFYLVKVKPVQYLSLSYVTLAQMGKLSVGD